jgi:hypothetical protein
MFMHAKDHMCTINNDSMKEDFSELHVTGGLILRK